jgi:nucleotide-binding universal stress UspA family protein
MYETILVPTDGSDSANRAVEHALELAERFDSMLHAMYVVDTSRYGEPALSSAELVLNELEEEGNDLVAEIADRADNVGITTETLVRHGRPDEEITDYADDIDADVVVMGFQGHSHRVEGNMGSVARRVARSTDRPVLTV